MSTCSERLAAAAPPTKPAGGRSGSVARHATPCTHYHARDGAVQEHAFTHSLGSTGILYFGWAGVRSFRIMLKLWLINVKTGQGWFLNYVKFLAYYFFYWTVTLFGGQRFFTPVINIFLLSVESCACYLVVSILDQLFLEILTRTSYATSRLQIKPHSDQIELPPDRDSWSCK